MKKRLIITAAVLLIASLLAASVISASAAVYVQDGKFKYQLFEDDDTVAWAGYVSDTVDDVTVPRYYGTSTVAGVANYGLQNNSKIKSVDFMEAPDLDEIGMYAFSGCSSLESIIVPNSITSVGVSAFRNCTALKSAEYYGNSNSVSIEAFYGCSALENVRLSARLSSIQSRAFAGCSSLAYLELTDTITYIASNAFYGDNNLTLGVYYNSYAHRYAIDNNIPYVLLDSYLRGDANQDGRVDVRDVTKMQRYKAEMEQLNDAQFRSADVNIDCDVTMADITLLQRHLAEFEDALW